LPFWDELGVGAPRPGAGVAPAHLLGEQDAADLAAPDADAALAGGLGQGVERPMGHRSLVRRQLAIRSPDQPTGRLARHQGDDRTPLGLAEATFAPLAGAVGETVDAFLIISTGRRPR